jgi:hypothetical protein
VPRRSTVAQLEGDNFLGKDSASTRVRHRPVDEAAYAAFSAPIREIPPEDR